MRFAAAIYTALLLAVATPALPVGDLIIIGGRFEFDNDAVWDAMNEERLEGKPIGVIATASSNPSSTGNSMVRDLNDLFGPGTGIYLNVTETNGGASNASIVEQARQCGGFYFTGGDQRRIPPAFFMATGERTPLLEAIFEVYEAGGMIAGSSAGAAIMSDPMISGGYSDWALEYGAVPEQPGARGVNIMEGLGFFQMGITDQHHLQRGRIGRLLVATQETSFDYGFGIDENTALQVEGDTGWVRVLGAMGVFVVDVRGGFKDDAGRRGGLVLHYLDTGDRFHVPTKTIQVAGNKTPIAVVLSATDELVNADIWDDYEAWDLVTSLGGSPPAISARGTDASFDRLDLLFRKNEQTKVWRGANHSYENTRQAWTILNLELGVGLAGEPMPEAPRSETLEVF